MRFLLTLTLLFTTTTKANTLHCQKALLGRQNSPAASHDQPVKSILEIHDLLASLIRQNYRGFGKQAVYIGNPNDLATSIEKSIVDLQKIGSNPKRLNVYSFDETMDQIRRGLSILNSQRKFIFFRIKSTGWFEAQQKAISDIEQLHRNEIERISAEEAIAQSQNVNHREAISGSFDGTLLTPEQFREALELSDISYDLPEGAKVYRLGKGMTAKVYRIILKSGKERVIKVYGTYAPSADNLPIPGSKALDEDLKRIKLLRQLTEMLPEADRFEIPRFRRIAPRIVEIESVRGYTLDQLPEGYGEEVGEIENEFNAKVEAINDLIRSHTGLVLKAFPLDAEPFDEWQSEEEHLADHLRYIFSLHGGNVVFDPKTKELVIIDPK